MWKKILRRALLPASPDFRFVELESMVAAGCSVQFVHFETPFVQNQECAVWLLVPRVSIQYVRSRHPLGVIETLSMMLVRDAGNMPLFLKYEGGKCVGYSSAPPFRILLPIREPQTQHCLDHFGDRVRMHLPEANG